MTTVTCLCISACLSVCLSTCHCLYVSGCVIGSRDSHIALWRIADNDDDDLALSSSVAGCQSYTHWTAGLDSHESCDVVDDIDVDDDDDDLMRVSRHHSAMSGSRLSARLRRDRPLQVPLYYRTKPVSVKLCEKAEKVRAFAYDDVRQVTDHIFCYY